jgi:aminoglycoside phosphotransferase
VSNRSSRSLPCGDLVAVGDDGAVLAGGDGVSAEVRQWVARVALPGARVVRCRRLTGGITSTVHTVDLERAGERRRLVLKRWTQGEIDERRWWTDREARVLQLLETAGVDAPRYVASSDGRDSGDAPALLMTRLPGRVLLAPRDPRSWLSQMAAGLARLHEVPPPDELPLAEPVSCEVDTPPDSEQPKLWRHASEFLAQPSPAGMALIHGDYQHFNVLWLRERLSGIVDWTSTGIGHPDRDVGHCRLNLAVLFSREWADDFAAAYEAEAGRSTNPWWNVLEVSRYGGDDWQAFIPVQVAGRAPVDVRGMTARVEDLLHHLLP